MYIKNVDVVFQEVPGEISVCLSVAGCPLACPGCHSPELWTVRKGTELTQELYDGILKKYRNLATCVLFLGGEWEHDRLVSYLDAAISEGYKTCLYTGLDTVSDQLLARLTYLKTGPWVAALGGLESPGTNQKFVEVSTGTALNHLFWRK